MSLRNGPHLPTTQSACAEFYDFARQRNGGREKDLRFGNLFLTFTFLMVQIAGTISKFF
jgi:hypothetical protein